MISSYTRIIVAVVWVSFIKRRTFLEINENVSEVDNKIGHTLQEETYMKRNVTFIYIFRNYSVICQSVYSAYIPQMISTFSKAK